MTKAKHTRGPWVVAQRQLPLDRMLDDCTELLHMDGYAIHVARHTLSDDPAADIALIAAAPEMLEALKAVRQAVKYYNPPSDLQERLEALIAKAEGRTND